MNFLFNFRPLNLLTLQIQFLTVILVINAIKCLLYVSIYCSFEGTELTLRKTVNTLNLAYALDTYSYDFA